MTLKVIQMQLNDCVKVLDTLVLHSILPADVILLAIFGEET